MVVRLSADGTMQVYPLGRVVWVFLILGQVCLRLLLLLFVRTPTSVVVATGMVSGVTILQGAIGRVRLVLRRSYISYDRYYPRVRRAKGAMWRVTFQLLLYSGVGQGFF